uniref:Uncharacterized protein n=1 Tax=Panagrolaimus sp. PS1159 TaxID=55785 RepID=A0AC35GAJ9_9BILA
MSTKHDKYSFIEQSFTTSKNEYYSLNLNQSKQCTILVPVQLNSKPNNEKHCESDNYEKKEKLQLWNKSPKASSFTTLNEDNVDFKKRWKKENTLKTTNKSTLSLHIATYENSIEVARSNLFGDEKIAGLKKEQFVSIKKLCFTDSLKCRNPFEFPRQQNGDQKSKPEVMQFKASQPGAGTAGTGKLTNSSSGTSKFQYSALLKKHLTYSDVKIEYDFQELLRIIKDSRDLIASEPTLLEIQLPSLHNFFMKLYWAELKTKLDNTAREAAGENSGKNFAVMLLKFNSK